MVSVHSGMNEITFALGMGYGLPKSETVFRLHGDGPWLPLYQKTTMLYRLGHIQVSVTFELELL